MKLDQEPNMAIGEINLINSYSTARKAGRRNYTGCTGKLKRAGVTGKTNWNGAMIDFSKFTFSCASDAQELLTCGDILDCLVFADRNKDSVTVTFTKDFLRKIVKSHMKNVREEIN